MLTTSGKSLRMFTRNNKTYKQNQEVAVMSKFYDLSKSSAIPIDDVRAIADWTVQMLKEELTKRGATCSSDTKNFSY